MAEDAQMIALLALWGHLIQHYIVSIKPLCVPKSSTVGEIFSFWVTATFIARPVLHPIYWEDGERPASVTLLLWSYIFFSGEMDGKKSFSTTISQINT